MIESATKTINTVASQATFTTKKLGFITVKGTLTGMSGNIVFNPENLGISSFDVCIDTRTINTGSSARDKHLKSDDFLDVEIYPSICFKSNEVKASTNGFLTKGTLSITGKNKEIEIPFSYHANRLEGQFTINRTDFQLGKLPTFFVKDQVNISISCVIS